MKNKISTKAIAGTGILIAIEIVLQLFSILVPTAVTINLSLITIVLAALLYGPLAGGLLGLINGVIVICTPNTIEVFFAISPWATILTCLLKTTAAGVAAGFIAKALQKKNDFLGSIIAAIVTPTINTLIFCIFCFFFFKEGLGLPTFGSIITAFIGVNFLTEVIFTGVATPAIYKALTSAKLVKKNN